TPRRSGAAGAVVGWGPVVTRPAMSCPAYTPPASTTSVPSPVTLPTPVRQASQPASVADTSVAAAAAAHHGQPPCNSLINAPVTAPPTPPAPVPQATTRPDMSSSSLRSTASGAHGV